MMTALPLENSRVDLGADLLADPVRDVADGRARLDVVDEQIRELVRARRQISSQVQQLRRAAGGPRIEHARENEILARYGDALGRPGVTLALAVLELCRGTSAGS
jgi:chorismate mutase